jgi:hypothetical protein
VGKEGVGARLLLKLAAEKAHPMGEFADNPVWLRGAS